MIALPEVAGLMNRKADPACFQPPEQDPFIAACQRIAAQHSLWLHMGSTPTKGPGTRLLNHSVLINDRGEIAAEYDKIHLFDVQLDGGKPILESSRFAAGDKAVVAQTPWGPMGMSVCYDLRFPVLYRTYAQQGAVLLFVPSAFTVPTGAAHWETLLRARAIENGAFVVAAAQCGQHMDGRRTYGHSMIVGPWGEVVADMEDAIGLQSVTLDISGATAARSQIPSLVHDRDYSGPD